MGIVRTTGRALWTLWSDPESALFLIRRRLWPIWYRVRGGLDGEPEGRGGFLDLGSNYGQGLIFFKRLYPPTRFDYVLVEPNSHCKPALEAAADRLRKDGATVDVIMKAGWDAEGTVRLSFPAPADDPDALGASIVEDRGSGMAVEVDTIDVGGLVESLATSHTRLVIKMDIEGAELVVLPRILQVAESIANRVILYVEFHSWYRQGEARARTKKDEKEILKAVPANVVVREWH